jgi:hypothetical protein
VDRLRVYGNLGAVLTVAWPYTFSLSEAQTLFLCAIAAWARLPERRNNKSLSQPAKPALAEAFAPDNP